MISFLYHYVRSMRLYYCFVTGTTVLLGIVMARCLSANADDSQPTVASKVTLLLVGFLAWGVNQIISDYLDRKEDAINAPHRPMVSGALSPRPALLLSALLMVAFAIASSCVSVWTLPVLACGALLNAFYSFLKKVPVLNCIIYACAITCCALFGYAGSLHRFPQTSSLLSLAFHIVPIHFLMCHNSYYKDVPGDRAAGIRTLQTCCPRYISIAVTLGLFAAHFIYGAIHLLNAFASPIFQQILFVLHLLTLVLLAGRHLESILKQNYHQATRLNCEICVCMLYTHLLKMKPVLLIPEMLSILTIEALFLWYRDEKE
ncbi:MAG: UbiA family prenyltransferase [Victivallales bacterium]|nr:UbiA family prenyltransferase [Victivallales bacterium]